MFLHGRMNLFKRWAFDHRRRKSNDVNSVGIQIWVERQRIIFRVLAADHDVSIVPRLGSKTEITAPKLLLGEILGELSVLQVGKPCERSNGETSTEKQSGEV